MFSKDSINITVGIMTYDRPELLKEAVMSVLKQTYESFELLISNDFPDVPVTIESLGVKEDSRIKIVNQNPNLGEVKNMNYLAEHATGEWFVWLADDDLMHPEFLKIAVESLINNQENNPVAFYSNYSSAASPENVFPKPLSSVACECNKTSKFLLDYTSMNKELIGCYGLIRKDFLLKIGGLPSLGNSFGPYSDTLVPILMTEFGRICWVNEKLIFLRTHAESMSCISTDLSAYTSAEAEFLINLKRICSNNNLKNHEKKLFSNMIKWFCRNQWVVISRNHEIKKIKKIYIFFILQFSDNLIQLKGFYKIFHIMYVIKFLILLSLFYFYSKAKKLNFYFFK